MKKLEDLYLELYNFEKAKVDLEKLIEQEFLNGREFLVIPKKILTCFLLNMNQSQVFLKDLQKKGYEVKFSDDHSMSISLIDTSSYLIFCKYLSQDLDELLGCDTVQSLILSLIKKYPSRFKIHGSQGSKYGFQNRTLTYRKSHDAEFHINLDDKKMKIEGNNERKNIYFSDNDIAMFELAIKENEINKDHLEPCVKHTGKHPREKRKFESELQVFESFLKEEIQGKE